MSTSSLSWISKSLVSVLRLLLCIPEACSSTTKVVDKTRTSAKTLRTGTRASKILDGVDVEPWSDWQNQSKRISKQCHQNQILWNSYCVYPDCTDQTFFKMLFKYKMYSVNNYAACWSLAPTKSQMRPQRKNSSKSQKLRRIRKFNS